MELNAILAMAVLYVHYYSFVFVGILQGQICSSLPINGPDLTFQIKNVKFKSLGAFYKEKEGVLQWKVYYCNLTKTTNITVLCGSNFDISVTILSQTK